MLSGVLIVGIPIVCPNRTRGEPIVAVVCPRRQRNFTGKDTIRNSHIWKVRHARAARPSEQTEVQRRLSLLGDLHVIGAYVASGAVFVIFVFIVYRPHVLLGSVRTRGAEFQH